MEDKSRKFKFLSPYILELNRYFAVGSHISSVDRVKIVIYKFTLGTHKRH